ncbi:hypothetical protein BJY04DRAFT_102115 [Aspergillus karnatakaensis]|uniref:uncharacterized protein n=1 Tax=Aspergillus karnatakaensis TaxID=1810916 RepID=UPI003CCE0876
MNTASPMPSWTLRKQVLVSLPHADDSCLAKLYIDYDGKANQGTISLNFKATLAKPTDRPEQFSLNISPSAVESYQLVQPTTETIFPKSLLAKLPAQTSGTSTVATLILDLYSIGAVAGPPLVQPPDQEDSNFAAFEKIFRSRSLYIHFARRQFQDGELDRLKAFFSVLKEGLQPKIFNHARKGRVERDGHVFGKMLDPPPYQEEVEAAQVKDKGPLFSEPQARGEHVGGKRPRDYSPFPPEDGKRRKPVLSSPVPSYYSTEPNTPPTPSIRPTHFARAPSPGRTERETLARIEDLLQGASDNLIRQLMFRLECRCQRAIPERMDLPLESENPSSTKVERFAPGVREYIDRAIVDHFKSDNLQAIFDSMVSRSFDQFFEACKVFETEFREQVEECHTEVRITADDCMKEMQEQAQQCMDDIKVQGEEVEMCAEAKAAEFRSWLDTRFLLGSKPSAHIRRGSC